MFSNAAREEFARFARQGRIAGAIDFTLTPPRPRLGTEASLRWNAEAVASTAQLIGPDGAGEAVAAVGQRSVLIDREAMSFALHAGTECIRLEVQPVLLLPRITHIQIPGHAVAGEPFQCCIEAAHAARLIVTLNGRGLLRRFELVSGRVFQLEFPLSGPASVLIEAEGVDLRYSQRARVSAVRKVQVAAAPLSIGSLVQRMDLPLAEPLDMSSLVTLQGYVGCA